MPITPLHLGLLAPINHWLPGRVSNSSFLIMTLWADTNAILYFMFGMDSAELHGPISHSFLGAAILGSALACCRLKDPAWAWGCYLGGFSHILLDMLVHTEMLPLYPAYNGNPFFWGHMDWLSLILVAPLVWLIAQYVSSAAGRIRAARAERP